MSKSSERDAIEVEAYQMPSGRWGVRTSFMKMPVGGYLGKDEDLQESEARDLGRRWMEMQKRSAQKSNLELFTLNRAKKSKHLKQGD